jgi:hypothetical protein
MKVDASGNAWISCADWYNGMTYAGSAEEYSNTGTLVNTYKGACPSNLVGCQSWSGFGDDVAFDGSGGVYVADPVAQPCVGTPSSCTVENGTGFEYFASPSSQPIYSNVYGNQPSGCASACTNVSSVYYFDVDSSGNIWTTFYGCEEYGSYLCGIGIAEVTGVSSGNPSFSIVVAPGVLAGSLNPYFNYIGGIFISGGTVTLTDGYNRTVYQYALPITPSSVPSTLGVTRANPAGLGLPLIGGFNATGSTFVVADAYGWVDRLKGGKATVMTNINFANGITAAGYAPSNK